MATFLSTWHVPQDYTIAQKRQLVTRSADYQLIAWKLYKLEVVGILRRCIMEHERFLVLQEAHAGIAGGHNAGKAIRQKKERYISIANLFNLPIPVDPTISCMWGCPGGWVQARPRPINNNQSEVVQGRRGKGKSRRLILVYLRWLIKKGQAKHVLHENGETPIIIRLILSTIIKPFYFLFV